MKDIKEKLLEKLIEYERIDPTLSPDKITEAKEKFAFEEIDVNNFNILKVRDAIMGLGTILEENLDKKYYITTIKIGSIGAYEAVAIAHLGQNKLSIAAYAKEGLLFQNNARKAVDKIKARIK